MQKNKSKFIIAILTAIIMLFTCSICFAADENSSNEATLIAEQEESNNDSSESNAVNSDLYLLDGGNVTVDYVVDGNVYIIADTVTITSQIGGDAFIIANTINIDGGYIYSNLFALAQNITINGIVYDLYSCSNAVTIGENGYVYRDAHTITNDFNIFGAIGRNVATTCTNILFTSGDENESHGTIYGNLEYVAENEVAIDESYVIGEITFNQETKSATTATTIESYLYSLSIYVIMAVAIYLLATWLTPKFIGSSKELLSKKILPVIGFGLLGLLVVPIIAIILMMLQVTVKVAFAILALYIALLFVASSIFIVSLSGIVAEKLKFEGFGKTFGIVVCVAVLMWAIELIPYLGGFVVFASAVLGTGLLIKNILPKGTKKAEETTTENSTNN